MTNELKYEQVGTFSCTASFDNDKIYRAVFVEIFIDGYIYSMTLPLPLQDVPDFYSDISVDLSVGYDAPTKPAKKTNDTNQSSILSRIHASTPASSATANNS